MATPCMTGGGHEQLPKLSLTCTGMRNIMLQVALALAHLHWQRAGAVPLPTAARNTSRRGDCPALPAWSNCPLRPSMRGEPLERELFTRVGSRGAVDIKTLNAGRGTGRHPDRVHAVELQYL